tara:strand:+ start:137 stop:718 length:582 start_codon:yes stop_codon:yes gene_type:complete
MALTRLGLNQSINLASNTTGTLAVANGGTGLTSGTADQFLKFTGTTTVASSALSGVGKIGQVIQSVKTSGQTISSGSYVAVSSLTANITCSATSSKVLVMISMPSMTISGGDNEGGNYSLYRNGSAEYKFGGNHGYSNDGSAHVMSCEFTRIHEPSSTSQQTYAVYAEKNGNSSIDVPANGTQATITLMEILA